MKVYPIPMVPGPVLVPRAVLNAYQVNYGSADLEPDFLELFRDTESALQRIMRTKNTVVIQSGEGMLALWSALKSCLSPGDRVLSVGTGLFGEGIGDMAAACGAAVKTISFPHNETIADLATVEEAVDGFRPKMITAVHCETPSGTLNPLEGLGRIKQEHGVPLFYVDAVSSIGGAEVRTDDWHIDLCLGGSQKCLSCLPDLSFVSVSDAAWDIVENVGYAGYDALKPFREAVEKAYFPYTPNWHAVAALHAGAQGILEEGLEPCFARHLRVAAFCRERLKAMGIRLFPAPGAVPSPTVTAAMVPESLPWERFDRELRKQGLAVGGNYGPLAAKVFRIGHMGSQADRDLVGKAMSVIQSCVHP